MKKLLASSALVLVGFASAASAQSVLERVLGKIDNSTNLASVNGTFANIAENIGGTQTIYVNSSGASLTAEQLAALDAQPTKADYVGIGATDYVSIDGKTRITASAYANLSATDKANYSQPGANAYYYDANGALINAAAYGTLYADENTQDTALGAYKPVAVAGLAGIDGSILNVVDGITDATQTATAGVVNAVEYNMPTLNWGAMSTTVLGAVNTGEITLGVNQSVEQAKTTSTGALSSLVDQLGGSADTGAIVLNVASNMTGVNGSIRNTMTEVNGSVGALGTTVLGAVNTGTITSGVNAAVSGIVGGGTSQTGGIPAN